MPPFKKGGSFVRFFVEGSLPDVQSEEFFEALSNQRFRSIENAASEETSVGWVAPSDPSGQDFLRDDILLGDYVRLRIRIDKKKLPAAWLAIHMAAELRAREGQKISAREKKAIKADIEDRVLPRTLPSVSFVEVVLVPHDSLVLLFSSSAAAGAECAKLMHKTFGVSVVEVDPTSLAERAPVDRDRRQYLERCSPFSLRDSQQDDSRIELVREASPSRDTVDEPMTFDAEATR
ncbi:MAG: recombination-associated protein RdgC [Planctomycetes bacterium]|nr:recombination-associated protein RdgC [Planctomycetota bacterium]